VFKMIYQYIR